MLDPEGGGTALEAVLEPVPPPPDPSRRPAPDRPASKTLLVSGAAVATLAVIPALYLVLRASGAGTTGIWEVLAGAHTMNLVLRTSVLVVSVTLASVAIGVPMAWLTVRTDLPARRAWVVLTALPLVIPSYVAGYAFVGALGPRGILQGWLAPLGVERLPEIYGFGGAWLVLTLVSYPYVLLTVRAAVRGLDPSLEEVARSLGGTGLWRRLTLPLLRPSIVSGALLVALYTLHDFGAVSLLRYNAFTRAIYVSYQASFDRTAAAVLGLVLVALTLVVLWGEGLTRTRAAYHPAHSGARRSMPVTRLGRWRWPAFAACCLLVVVALGIPLGVIGYWLVRGFIAGEPLRLAVGAAASSVQVSAMGAVAALAAAWPVAVLSARHPGRASRWVERAGFVGYALPGVVVALALVYFGIRAAPFAYQTRAMLAFSYVVLFLPVAVGALRSSLLQVPPSLEEAARSLGSGPAVALRRVVIPLVRPGALTALSLVFLTAMKELPATLILAPPGFRTLATQVWGATSEAFFARAAGPALAIVLLSSAPLAYLVARESSGTGKGKT